jgi:hypothetical protein
MANQIGQFSFTVWEGSLQQPEQEVALFYQPGVDDPGVQFGAYPVRPQTVITKLTVSLEATADTLIAQYKQLRKAKQTVSVIDQFGKIWPNVLILGVGSGAGVNMWKQFTVLGWRVSTRWDLLIRAERP